MSLKINKNIISFSETVEAAKSSQKTRLLVRHSFSTAIMIPDLLRKALNMQDNAVHC